MPTDEFKRYEVRLKAVSYLTKFVNAQDEEEAQDIVENKLFFDSANFEVLDVQLVKGSNNES